MKAEDKMANSQEPIVNETLENDGGREWALAREGISLFINNKPTEAESLFLKYPDSLVMYSGYSFIVVMDALMGFEEEKLSKATVVLKEVERRCTVDSGWLKSLSSRVFGSGNENEPSLADQLETQIILADSQVCMAILTFLQHDLSGYFKGGWVLRKAWKVYQKTYKDILTLHKERIGELELPDPITPTVVVSPLATLDGPSDMDFGKQTSDWEIPEAPINGYSHYFKSSISRSHSSNFTLNNTPNFVDTDDVSLRKKSISSNSKKLKPPKSMALKKSTSVTDALSSRFSSTRFNFRPLTSSLSFNSFATSLSHILPGKSYRGSQSLDKKTLVRLMGAISFGHGLFQLGISLLPPSLTRLVSFLGFAANGQNGISCLMYTRLGTDMRAPLASLSLLWYHTIVRPFYAIDGTNVRAGAEAAWVLLNESKKEFGDSALFLFFAGRTSRLDSDIPGALKSFQKANENTNHHEIRALCLHEIGWCHLILLAYEQAKCTFVYLKSFGRWSRTFYGYLAAICIGSIQEIRSYIIFDELHSSCASCMRSGQLDEFLRRRNYCCPKNAEEAKKHNAIYFKLLVFEMLYLWNSLTSCNKENINTIIADCQDVTTPCDEPRIGLSNLILGACYTLQKNFPAAEESYRRCLHKRVNEEYSAEDAHISAFAQNELGHILLQKEETKEEGKLLLEQISKYTRYDFEGRLNVKIHNTLKNL